MAAFSRRAQPDVYARALLQNADLVILDESLGALDPATLRRCLQTARDRARTLLVSAHP